MNLPWWPSITRLKKCLTVLHTAEHPAFLSPSHRRDKDSRACGKEVNPNNHFFTVSLQLIGILHAPFAFPHTLIYPVDVDSGLWVIIQCYLCIWAFLFLFHSFQVALCPSDTSQELRGFLSTFEHFLNASVTKCLRLFCISCPDPESSQTSMDNQHFVLGSDI